MEELSVSSSMMVSLGWAGSGMAETGVDRDATKRNPDMGRRSNFLNRFFFPI